MKRDHDSQGRPLEYEVEIWEWTNYLKNDGKVSYKTFYTKKEAERFCQERMIQGLVTVINVNRKTYKSDTGISLPIETKRIVHYDVFEQQERPFVAK